MIALVQDTNNEQQPISQGEGIYRIGQRTTLFSL